MSLAIAVARQQLGRTRPNPSVGCVLVKDGALIAAAATADGGRPHAERQALETVGSMAAGATAYVTLEPCAHHGQTPPCAEALIEAKVNRVVCAVQDEDSRVAGRGLAMLREAGIETHTGLCATEATALYSGFFNRLRTGQPGVFVDRFEQGFDDTLDLVAPEHLETALDRLGEAGVSRLRVAPDHPLLITGRLKLL